MFSGEARNVKAFLFRWKIQRFPVFSSNPRRNVKISYSWFLLLNFLQDSVVLWKTSLHSKQFQHCLIFTFYSIAVFLLVCWRKLQHILIQNWWYLSGMLTYWIANWLLQLWFTTTYLYLILMVLFRCPMMGNCNLKVYSFHTCCQRIPDRNLFSLSHIKFVDEL